DRTALESTGWVDPYNNGPSVYTVGAYFNRPDRTSFYIGYRHIELLQSNMVTGSATYVFSPKYAVTFTASYDFGVSKALNNSVLFTRTGTDLQVSLGINYNTLQNNFGLVVEVVPNLLPVNKNAVGTFGGPGGLLSR